MIEFVQFVFNVLAVGLMVALVVVFFLRLVSGLQLFDERRPTDYVSPPKSQEMAAPQPVPRWQVPFPVGPASKAPVPVTQK